MYKKFILVCILTLLIKIDKLSMWFVLTGAYGPEKGQKIADLDTDKKKKEKEKEKDTTKTDKVSQWRKEDGSSRNQKVRYVYKSIEDVLEESKQPGKKKSKREFKYVKYYLKRVL